MKKWGVLFAAVCALLAFVFIAFSGEIAKSVQGREVKSDQILVQYAPDRILVKFKDDVKGMVAEAGRAQVEYVHNLKRLKHFSRIDVYVYLTEGSIEATLKALKQNPNVAYAEPDYIVTADITIPNDASFVQLWGLNNSGQTGGTVDADIDAPEAWDLTTGSSNVIVAVIDSGVAYSHPDLNANMWVNPGEVAANGLDDDANGYVDDVYGINSITGSGDPMDDNNHGTHCSGTIAGVGNNGLGVAGVCWTARIMALKFLNADGNGDISNAIECVEYAISKGAHILSNSWGGGGYSQAMKDAIDDAATAGLLFCAAAGNYIKNNDVVPFYPSSYSSPNIVAVAATDHNDALSIWTPGVTGSHWGAYSVDVAAPGSSIYSTIPGDSYASFNGTSMATPHVAGLAALIKSYNYSLNWMQIRDRILGAADPLPSLSGLILTGARVNAYDSLLMGEVTSYQLNVQSAPSGVSITVSPADLDGYSSGTTNFTRRYTPYETVTLTAPETFSGMNFGYWVLEGSRYSGELSISLPIDFIHTAVATYTLPLANAIDNTSLSVVTFGVQGGWVGQIGTYHSGGDAAQSQDAGDSQSGTMQTSVRGPGTMTFYWKVSSESGYDLLTFVVDGVSQNAISGEVDWQQVSYPVADGLHVIQWTYSKNASVSGGSDCGWVDNIQFSGIPATLGQALDQQSLGLTTGEYGGWFPQATTFHYDADSVQSSKVQHGEQTALMTTVAGPTPLSFYWRVSSESGYDFLRFYIDSVLQNSISGTVDWTQTNYSLGSGSHVLTWVYAKDVSVSNGSDCGWVDHVALEPAGTYALSLAKAGTGGGKVKVGDDPVAHDLPYGEVFASGIGVGLEAVPDATSVFTSWSGDFVSTGNPVTVTMDSNKAIAANFTSTVPSSVTVTSPNGGESWSRSSTRAITWTQTSLTGTVTIDLHKGGSYRRTLGTAEAAAGTFSWSIPAGETIGTDYRIVIWQDSVSDISDADFSVEAVSPILLQESFSGSTIPTGWTYQNVGTTTPWYIGLTSNAGGSPNEMRRGFSTGTLTRLVTPPINTIGRTEATLSFKHFFDTWSSGGVVLKVQTSPDGTNWTDEAWTVTAGTTNIGPETVNTVLANNLGIATTYVGFVLAGNLVYMDFWYIDDISIGSSVAPSVCRVDFNGDGQEDILWRYYAAGGYNRAWFLENIEGTGLAVQVAGAAQTNGLVGDKPAGGRGSVMTSVGRPRQMEGGLVLAKRSATMVPRNLFGNAKGRTARQRTVADPRSAGAKSARSSPEGVTDPRAVRLELGLEAPLGASNGTASAPSFLGGADVLPVGDLNWQIAGTGDFDNDTHVDILWRNVSNGMNIVWLMNGSEWNGSVELIPVADLTWQIVGMGDFNNDTHVDILWRNVSSGENVVWYLNGTTWTESAVLLGVSDQGWKIVGTGDFNKDGAVDILWRYDGAGGYNVVWYLNGANWAGSAELIPVGDPTWQIAGTGDYDRDGSIDILWRYNGAGGYNVIWYMDGVTWRESADLLSVPDLTWRIVSR